MGKRLDQLGDLSQPVGDPGRDELAIAQRDRDRFIQHCKALELDPDCAYAYETIAGIRATIELSGVVSDGQRRAIRNIEVGAERARSGREDRDRRGGWGRRYEGR